MSLIQLLMQSIRFYGMDSLDGKGLVRILTPLLGCYDRHFTKAQWQHWAQVLGEMKPKDLEDSVQWWLNNREQFPPSPAALKSHAFDQVKKQRFQDRQLKEYDRIVDDRPSPEERLPPDQVKAYCKYIIEEIVEKRKKAPDRANKARFYEKQMEEYYENQEG